MLGSVIVKSRKKYRVNSGKAEMLILSQDRSGTINFCKVQRLRRETNNNRLLAPGYLEGIFCSYGYCP